MIRKILTYYAGRLDEYLGRTHRQPEGLATVGLLPGMEGLHTAVVKKLDGDPAEECRIQVELP